MSKQTLAQMVHILNPNAPPLKRKSDPKKEERKPSNVIAFPKRGIYA